MFAQSVSTTTDHTFPSHVPTRRSRSIGRMWRCTNAASVWTMIKFVVGSTLLIHVANAAGVKGRRRTTTMATMTTSVDGSTNHNYGNTTTIPAATTMTTSTTPIQTSRLLRKSSSYSIKKLSKLQQQSLCQQDSSRFNICLDLSRRASPVVLSETLTAAERWMQIITDDLPTVELPSNETATIHSICGYSTNFPNVLDDLNVCVQVRPIDGKGGVLGFGFPFWVRPGSDIPVLAAMAFDEADVPETTGDRLFQGIVQHEIGEFLFRETDCGVFLLQSLLFSTTPTMQLSFPCLVTSPTDRCEKRFSAPHPRICTLVYPHECACVCVCLAVSGFAAPLIV